MDYYAVNVPDVLDAESLDGRERDHEVRLYLDDYGIPKYLLMWEPTPVDEDDPFKADQTRLPSAPRLMGGVYIEQIDDNCGMVLYNVFLPDYYQSDEDATTSVTFFFVAKQLFRILRQCYHRHVWTDGDFRIHPILAWKPGQSGVIISREVAAEALWMNCFNKRLFVTNINFLRRAYFKCFKASETIWVTLRESCAGGMGELLYAEVLAKCVREGRRQELLDICKRGREQYDAIWRLLTAKQSGLENLWSKIIDFMQCIGVAAAVVTLGWQDQIRDILESCDTGAAWQFLWSCSGAIALAVASVLVVLPSWGLANNFVARRNFFSKKAPKI